MSPQVVLVLAVILILGISIVLPLRASGARQRRDTSEPLAEPGSEGMHVADDGEIAPGAPERTTD